MIVGSKKAVYNEYSFRSADSLGDRLFIDSPGRILSIIFQVIFGTIPWIIVSFTDTREIITTLFFWQSTNTNYFRVFLSMIRFFLGIRYQLKTRRIFRKISLLCIMFLYQSFLHDYIALSCSCILVIIVCCSSVLKLVLVWHNCNAWVKCF